MSGRFQRDAEATLGNMQREAAKMFATVHTDAWPIYHTNSGRLTCELHARMIDSWRFKLDGRPISYGKARDLIEARMEHTIGKITG